MDYMMAIFLIVMSKGVQNAYFQNSWIIKSKSKVKRENYIN